MLCYRLVIPLACSILTACVSSGEDYAVAADVGRYLDATGVIPSNTQEADRTHKGRIVYIAPGRNGAPHFTYYEVTDPRDIQKLTDAAEAALKNVPAAKKINLHFMERQVFHQSANGAGYRGRENEIKTVVVQRGK